MTIRWTCIALLVAATVAGGSASAFAQDGGRPAIESARAGGGLVIEVPALSLSAQEGGEVKRREPEGRTSRAGEPAPLCVHFWHTPGHWLEWNVHANAADDYAVTIDYAGKHDVLRRLALNGEPVKGLDPFTLKRTGRWSTWGETTLPATVTLKEGRNVLRMTCLDQASIRLRTITFSREGRKDIVVPAGKLGNQGGGRAQVLVRPTQGYVSAWRARGHWLEWTVEARSAGACDVHLLYSSDGYSPRELRVNGEPVKGLESFILPVTGDGRHWTWGKLPVPIALKAGRNTLRLTPLTGDLPRDPPRIDGDLGLSVIRLVSPPEASVEPAAVITVAQVAARQKQPYRVQPDVPPAPLGPPLPEVSGAVPLAEGETFDLAGRKATISKADVLPYVENKFSKRFVYANYDNPELRRLRKEYNLDAVVAAGKDEFEKQALLMKWVWDQWDFGHGRELYNLRDPFWILDEAKREHKFQCMHSGSVLLSAANSLGWVSRPMAIPRHTFNEIWSNQLRKWVMFDATSNYYPEKDGRPLNTYEQRQAPLREGGGVMRAWMGEGGIQRKPQSDSYGRRLLFVGYIPNTNYLVRGPMYGSDQFFITKDELCGDRKWHTRDCPENPAVDPYFPINQAALALVPEGGALKVTVGTLTPNFKTFEVRIDDGEWKPAGTGFNWPLHPGKNRLEARSVNKFDVDGPTSTVAIDVSP